MNEKYEHRINSGVLLLLNAPKLMEFGIDYSSWTIGEKFMGIKLIPDGPHFIYYSTPDENNYFKQGFFINVNSKSKVHIRKWNAEVGDFVNLKEEEEENFRIGVNNLDFDAYLGVYPIQQIDNWRDLTNYITPDLLEKLEPINKKYITSSKEYEESNVTNTEIKGNIYFTEIPGKKFCLSFKSDHDYLTKINMDKSTILEDLIAKEYKYNTNMLLGEFQYAYVTFLLCDIYESFEQWKTIFILISSSQESIRPRENFFCEFIEVIYNMFRQFPKDFFFDNITSSNFLSKIIGNFIRNCENAGSSAKLTKRAKLLEKFLKEYFNFEIKDEESKIIEKYLKSNINPEYEEDEDELPVIVDQSEIENIMKYRDENEGDNTVASSVRIENDADSDIIMN